MIRILGFFIGSATSIIVILLLVGMPDFQFDDSVIDQKRFDEAVEKLMARNLSNEFGNETDGETGTSGTTPFSDQNTQDIDTSHTEPGDDYDAARPRTQTLDTQPQTAAVNDPDREMTFGFGDPPELNSADEKTTRNAIIALDEFFDPTELQWYAFWSPFRSNIAANGFVTQLQRVTGMDYRIVKSKTGVYEVAFAYKDNNERQQKLALISSATGLDLPDS